MWKRIRWFFKEFLVDSIFQGIWFAFSAAKAVGTMIGGGIIWIVKALADVNWLLTVLIFLVSCAIFIIAIDVFLQWLGKSKLKVVFCDAQGNFVNSTPTTQFWEWSGGSICFLVHGFFRLSNHTSEERTLEDAYVVLKAGNEELQREKVQKFPVGERIQSFDTTQTPIAFHAQPFADRIKLEQLVGLKFEETHVVLVVKATGAIAKFRFKSHYQEP